jgi:hypothetical protein
MSACPEEVFLNRRLFSLAASLVLPALSPALPIGWGAMGQVGIQNPPPIRTDLSGLLLAGEFGPIGTSTDPKLIVLVHGMSTSPNDAASEDIPEPDSGTLDFARFYFSFPFVAGLMGVGPSGSLRTLSGVRLNVGSWEEVAGTPSSRFKVRYRHAANEAVSGDHFLVPADWSGSGCPPVAVLLTRRDASQRLMPQSKALLNHVYEEYKAIFGTHQSPTLGKTPNIIFVCHSFGNLATRVVLTNPSTSVLGQALTPVERERADAIRDKTICLVSLAGPHEGSPIANYVSQIQNNLGTGEPAQKLRGLLDSFSVKVDLLDAVHRELGQPAVQDLTSPMWEGLNRTSLRPDLMVRKTGGLIPVYALSGHRPSGRFGRNPLQDWDTGATSAPVRERFRSTGLMFVDYLLYMVHPDGWGTTSKGSQLDQMARYKKLGFGLLGISEPGHIERIIPLGLPVFHNAVRETRQETNLFGSTRTVVVRDNSDSLVDSDGFVGAASGYGWNLGTSSPRYFDHSATWTVGGRTVRGSWYRIIRQENLPWADANHETIMRLGSVGAWIRANIVQQAGPVPAAGPISVWP